MAFNRGRGFGGGGRGFKRDFRDREERQMFSTVCSNCGRECEVPFRPTGERPVFCSDCFEKQGGGRREDRGPQRGPDRGSRPPQPDQFRELNSKLDRIISLLEDNSSDEGQKENEEPQEVEEASP